MIMHVHFWAVYNSATYAINELHKIYHVVSQPQTVEKYIKGNCMVCRNQTAVPESQMIVSFPAGRVKFSEAPSNIVGTPLETKKGSHYLLRCCCVFTCLALRAVHQEIAYCII